MDGDKLTIQKLEEAYDIAQSGMDMCQIYVFISKSTGEICFFSDFDEEIDEAEIERLENDDDFVKLPDKSELDLGSSVVWEFVDREIPQLKHTVESFFKKRGAYSKFKNFLDNLGILDKWYTFDENRTRKALLEWARENDIEVQESKD